MRHVLDVCIKETYLCAPPKSSQHRTRRRDEPVCISVAEVGKVPFISGSTTNEVRVPPLMAMNAIHPEWMPETRIWHLGQDAEETKSRPIFNQRRLACREFVRSRLSSKLLTTIAHHLIRPQAGSPVRWRIG